MLNRNARLIELGIGEQRRAARLDQIGFLAIRDCRNNLAGAPDLRRISIEPFERQPGVDQAEISRLLTLAIARRWPHHRERCLDAERPERPGQLQAVDPDSADGVGDEKKARPAHPAALANCG